MKNQEVWHLRVERKLLFLNAIQNQLNYIWEINGCVLKKGSFRCQLRGKKEISHVWVNRIRVFMFPFKTPPTNAGVWNIVSLRWAHFIFHLKGFISDCFIVRGFLFKSVVFYRRRRHSQRLFFVLMCHTETCAYGNLNVSFLLCKKNIYILYVTYDLSPDDLYEWSSCLGRIYLRFSTQTGCDDAVARFLDVLADYYHVPHNKQLLIIFIVV